MDTWAVVFPETNRVELERRTVGEPGPDEVLIETSRTLISTGTECIVLSQDFSPGTHWAGFAQLPFVPGYSNVGRVRQLGADVTGVQEGDRVFTRAPHQKHVVRPIDKVVPVPTEVKDEQAAFGALAMIAQNGFRRAAAPLGADLVMVGQGLLGQLMTQYAHIGGAGEVIAVDPAEARLRLSEAHGATRTLSMGVAEAAEAVHAHLGGRGAEAVFEMTGHPDVFPAAQKLLRRFGKLVLVGDTGHPERQFLSHELLFNDLEVVTAHDSNTPPSETDWTPWDEWRMHRLFLSYVARGRMAVQQLITHRYDANDAASAYEMLMARRSAAMGVILDFSSL